jgi:hypothetical protein
MYVESDPIGLRGGSYSTYAYAAGDPLVFIDSFGLCWFYSQSTGNLVHVPSTGSYDYIATGYAGYGVGLNNPASQYMAGEPPNPSGPLPQGTYTIGPLQTYTTTTGKTLYNAMYLTPVAGNFMGNPPRGGFLIHGPHPNDNHDSSNGCPVIPKLKDRLFVAASNDNCLQVGP